MSLIYSENKDTGNNVTADVFCLCRRDRVAPSTRQVWGITGEVLRCFRILARRSSLSFKQGLAVLRAIREEGLVFHSGAKAGTKSLCQ